LKQKISIITINYNNLEGLKKTVSSVTNQTWKGFQFIIIDGGSNDGSLEYIKTNEDVFDYWVSESDNGVYHAMNKGIKNANGEYLFFLNSGDQFYNKKVLEKNNSFLKEKDIIYFNLKVIDENKVFIKEYPEVLSFSYFVKDTLPHPATFIKKELFDRIGLYDENLKIVSDWKFFMDAICKNNVSYKKVDDTLSEFHLDGLSSKAESRNIIFSEKQAVLRSEYAAYTRDLDDVIEQRKLINALRQSRIIKLLVKLGFLNKF
jgi:glycosyltransferase involved in cell wall biosynthesis